MVRKKGTQLHFPSQTVFNQNNNYVPLLTQQQQQQQQLLLLPPPPPPPPPVLLLLLLLLWSRDGVDGIQTRYKLGGSGFPSQGECKRFFCSTHQFRPVLGFLPWTKRPGCGVGQPLPYHAKVHIE